MERGAEIKLQVQIVAYGPEGMARVLKGKHPQVPGVGWLVSWQLPGGDLPVPGELAARPDFKVVKSHDTGVARNRNHALLYPCDAPLILLGDDDVDYQRESLLELIAVFEERPQVDIICMRYTCYGRYVKSYGEGEFSLRKPPYGWYVTTFEMALRRSCVGAVRFNEAFGPGSPGLVAGEETIFLHDLLRSGARGIGLPIEIGAHDHPTTSERMAGDPRFLRAWGAMIIHIRPLTWPLRLLLNAWRAPLPFLPAARAMLGGVKYALREHIYRQRLISRCNPE